MARKRGAQPNTQKHLGNIHHTAETGMLRFTTKTTQQILAPLVDAVTTLATANVQVNNLDNYAQQIESSVAMCAKAGMAMQRTPGHGLESFRLSAGEFDSFKRICSNGTNRQC